MKRVGTVCGGTGRRSQLVDSANTFHYLSGLSDTDRADLYSRGAENGMVREKCDVKAVKGI